MPVITSDNESIREVINQTNRIAVIGASSNRGRTSNRIFRYLREHGFEVIPVNPNEEAVEGEASYKSIHELPENLSPDMMLLFRNRKESASEVQKIVRWSEERGVQPTIWTQIGVSSGRAEEIAEEEGFTYVKNRCLMVDHSRLC